MFDYERQRLSGMIHIIIHVMIFLMNRWMLWILTSMTKSRSKLHKKDHPM